MQQTGRYDITAVLDLDSTAYDLITPWLAYYNNGWGDDLRPSEVEDWAWEKFIKPECGVKIYKFLHEEGMFYNLAAFEGCIEAVRKAHESGVRHIFASTCTTKLGPYEKQQAVDRDFPFIGKKNVIITGGVKGVINGDILFDDGPHNIDEFKRAGGLTCLVDMQSAPYCRKTETTPDYVMTNWDQYEAIIADARWVLKHRHLMGTIHSGEPRTTL